MTFPPIVHAVFGQYAISGYIWLICFKMLFAIGFLTMAVWNFCPVWSFTGLLVKYGLVGNISGKLSKKVTESLEAGGYYSQKDPSNTKRVAAIRYGRYGPLVETNES